MQMLNRIILIICSFVSIVGYSKEKPFFHVEHWKTKNGANVYFVQEKTLPIVDIVLAFDAGSARDETHFGLSTLTSNLFVTGTNKLNENAVVLGFENLGAQYNNSVDRDMAVLSLRTLVKPDFLNPSIDTFSQIIQKPAFPKQGFKRIQKQQLDSIKGEDQSPGNVAEKAFYQTLYGQHPYAHPILGTQESVQRITLKEVKSFYQKYYVANNLIITIVGDLAPQKAKSIAEKLVSKLPAGNKAPPLPPVKSLKKAVKKFITYPSEQTHILIGSMGIDYKNPNYFPLMVGNNILGSLPMISRLFSEVREKRGLSYSVFSYFDRMKRRGPFLISLQTRNGKANEALLVSNQILQAFIKKGPTEEELNASKQNIIGGFPLKLDNNAAIIQNLVNMTFYHLPMNYLDTYRDHVKNVSLAEIKNAFSKTIQPNKMVTIIVGKNEKSQ